MLFTITSFREIPLRLLETDEMLKPVTHMAVKKEKEKIKALESGKEPPPITTIVISEKNELYGATNSVVQNYTVSNKKNSSSSMSSSSDEDEDENEDSHITFVRF